MCSVHTFACVGMYVCGGEGHMHVKVWSWCWESSLAHLPPYSLGLSNSELINMASLASPLVLGIHWLCLLKLEQQVSCHTHLALTWFWGLQTWSLQSKHGCRASALITEPSQKPLSVVILIKVNVSLFGHLVSPCWYVGHIPDEYALPLKDTEWRQFVLKPYGNSLPKWNFKIHLGTIRALGLKPTTIKRCLKEENTPVM